MTPRSARTYRYSDIDRYVDHARRLRAEAFAAMFSAALKLPTRAVAALRSPRRGRYVAAR